MIKEIVDKLTNKCPRCGKPMDGVYHYPYPCWDPEPRVKRSNEELNADRMAAARVGYHGFIDD